MRLARRARTCPACDRREPPDARWCGDCGAALGRRPGPVVVHEDEAAAAGTVRTGVRRWPVVVLVAGVALLAGLLADPDAAGDPDLLGRLDDTSGRTSRLPPVDELQLVWQRPVDRAVAERGDPPVARMVGEDHLRLGSEVVDLRTGAVALELPGGAAVSPEGVVAVVDDGALVRFDARDGHLREPAATIADAAGWRPVGVAVGWVAGAAVLTDADGRVGAVTADGAVRWVGDPAWTWDGNGDGTDWLVVTDRSGVVDRHLVVDGTNGVLHRDLGPVGTVHAPVVTGDVVAWVDPFAGIDRGLGQPVEVHGISLDGTGRSWAVRDLPPTSGAAAAVRLVATGAGEVVVQYWTAGQATTATWIDAGGTITDAVAVGGTGTTAEGWPVSTAFGDVLAHVDPVRGEVRVVDRGRVIRWAVPARAGEGVVGAGDVVLVRTPPRDTSLQSRVRALDVTTGRLVWDRLVSGTMLQRFTTTLDGHVGVAPSSSRRPTVTETSWFALETGRRRGGADLLSGVLDTTPGAPVGDAVVLGRVGVGAGVRVVVLGADGQVVGARGATPDLVDLLGARQPAAVTVGDGELAVRVGAAGLVASDVATGRERWRVTAPVALHEGALLLDDVVVARGRDRTVRAWSRDDGTLVWTGPDRVTALTAGGQEVVVGTATGDVLVLAADGTVLQSARAGREPVEDVAVVDGMVVATVGQDVVGLGRGARFVEPLDRVEVP